MNSRGFSIIGLLFISILLCILAFISLNWYKDWFAKGDNQNKVINNIDNSINSVNISGYKKSIELVVNEITLDFSYSGSDIKCDIGKNLGIVDVDLEDNETYCFDTGNINLIKQARYSGERILPNKIIIDRETGVIDVDID